MKHRMLIAAILAIVAAAGVAAFLIMRGIPVSAPVAEIRIDGELYRRAPLSDDAEFIIDTEYGTNTVVISDGRVQVTQADCPDKICVQTGGISGGVVPIICLPHHLEIRVVSGSDSGIDAGAF